MAAESVAIEESDTILVMGLVVFCLVIAAWVLVSILGATRSAQIRQLDQKIESLDAQLDQPDIAKAEQTYLALDTTVSHMNQLRTRRFAFLPVWNTLKASVPHDMQFTSLSMGDTTSFQISGATKSLGSVAAFAKALQSKPDFYSVTPLSVQQEKDEGIYSFSLTFTTQPPVEESNDES